MRLDVVARGLAGKHVFELTAAAIHEQRCGGRQVAGW